MLEHLIKENLEEYENLIKIELALKDLICQNTIRQVIIDYCFYFNEFPINNNYNFEISSINKDELIILKPVYISIYKFNYETLIDLKDVEMSLSNEIKAGVAFKKEFNGISFIITQALFAEIPKEEMELLECLGKIEIEYVPAKKIVSVFCPNANPIPF